MSQRPELFLLQGGMDLAAPAVAVTPGRALAAMNYEATERGYRRNDGLERFDGHPAPSDAYFDFVRYSHKVADISVAANLNGQASAATGQVLAIVPDVPMPGLDILASSDEYFASNDIVFSSNVPTGTVDVDTGYLILHGTVGTFHDGENLRLGAAVLARAASAPLRNLAPTVDLTAFYLGQAAGVRRTLIQAVPGTGAVRGVAVLGDVLYAWRNGVDYCLMWRASPTGWALVPTPFHIAKFAGDTNDTVRTTSYDFGQGERLYCATGRGRAFEFDGSTAVEIVAPLSATKDKPTIAAVFSNHLFLFYKEGAVLFSEIGNPLAWTTTGGAGEIGLGSYPRDVIESASTALVIICRTKVIYLTGTDAATFEKKELSKESGGWGRSGQNIGRPVYLDQRGLRDLTAVDTFAGFAMGTLSNPVAKIFQSYEAAGTVPRASLRCQAKDQYRAFFSDGTGLAFYFGRDATRPEITRFRTPTVITCAISDASTEGSVFSGTERMFAGGANGFVYQMDKGPSLDGAVMEAFIRLPFNLIKAPHIDKRFHSADIGLDAAETTELGFSTAFDYGAGARSQGVETSATSYGAGGYWDEFNWDEFNWDSPVEGTIHVRIDGVGQSCSLIIASTSATERPHTLTSALLNWSPRKYRR